MLTNAFSVAWYGKEKGECIYQKNASDKWDINPWYITRKRCITSTYFYDPDESSWGNEWITGASSSLINDGKWRVYFNEKGKKYLISNIVSGEGKGTACLVSQHFRLGL